MDINERDYEFMEKVMEAYEENRSVRAVAKEFNLSRTKVRKILVTLGAINLDITEKALALKESGMDIYEIADDLGLSIATVSTYLPYDTILYKGEEKSLGAIRNEKYRKRNKNAAEKQVQRNEKDERNWGEEMKERDFKVLKLRMKLDIDGADMDVLKKYGKVKEGIVREVLAPANITLHALHYVIQKSFGWQNSHLHHFSLTENTFSKLTQNSFLKWADYCGIYFRFPSDDFKDIYWDDDYKEYESVKSWFRKKYTGLYQYHGHLEHFMEARYEVKKLINESKEMRAPVPFSEWIDMSEEERKKPRIKKIEDVTCDDMQEFFAKEGGIGELLERLKVTEILGEETGNEKLEELVKRADKRFEENDRRAKDECEYWHKMNSLNGTALPLTKELKYEYDYGDGWEVKITLLDEYYSDDAWEHPNKYGYITPAITEEQVFDDQTPMYKNGEIIEGELRDQIATVISKRRPLCIMADGLPVLDDVGGIGGYCEMLTGIYGEGSEHFDYDDPEGTKEWARMQGWTGRMSKPENVL